MFDIHERLKLTQRKIQESDLDAVIILLGVNILALLGFWPGNHAAAGFIPAEGKPILLVPETELLEAELTVDRDHVDIDTYTFESTTKLRSAVDAMIETSLPKMVRNKYNYAKIGLEMSFEDGAIGKLLGDYKFPSKATWRKFNDAFPEVFFEDATSLISELRFIKTEAEVAKIQETIAIAEKGLSFIYNELQPGLSEAKISSMIESNIICNTNARYSRAFTSVYSGKRSASQWVHYAYSSHRTVCLNEMVIVEMGCVSDGYWCDLTRCAVAGKPKDKMIKALEVVLEAQQRGLEAAIPGEPISNINDACYKLFKNKGFQESDYRHACGHGTGFNYHEGPPIHAVSKIIAKPGMVLCIEPGLYFDGEFGVRVEDIFVITEKGVKRLSEHPKSLALK